MNDRLRYTLICLILFFFSIRIGAAQDIPDQQNQFIQDIIEGLDASGDLDYNVIFEQLSIWADRPFDINKGDLQDLVNNYLISDLQKQAIEQHILDHGPLIAIYELQSIDALDLETLQLLRPFVTTQGVISDYQTPLTTMLAKGKNEFFFRWSKVLETQKGFTEAEDLEVSRYQGDPNRYYLRLRHSYENKLSYGVTAEKDPGEPFFSAPNESGFDFYSAHFYLKNYKSWLKAVAIGDYGVSLGQGLIYNSGFGTGKTSYVTKIKRGGDLIRPFRSVNEADFLRGGAIHLQPTKHLDVAVFGSSRKRDGSINTDTIDIDNIRIIRETSFTSFLNSGFHRTQNEIANKNKLSNTTIGGRVRLSDRKSNISLNVFHNSLSDAFQRPDQPHNLFRFQGDKLTNMSLDYTYIWRNVHFFGETAWSDNGAIASMNGLLLGLDRKIDAALMVRYFPKDYQSLFPSAFGETRQASNEYGVYFGLEIRPSKEWSINIYNDTWRHPWLRFNVDAPSQGNEQLLKVRYYLKRKFEIYAQIRREAKQRNRPANETNFDILDWQVREQLRLHMSQRLGGGLELRSRMEVSRYQLGDATKEHGYLVYQDFIYKPISFPLSFTGRIALFDTDGFNSRIFAYENDVIYSFFIPAYFDQGVRYYLNLRYKGIRNLTAEFRIARTEFTNQRTISSGLNEIEGNHRTEVKAQVIYRW